MSEFASKQAIISGLRNENQWRDSSQLDLIIARAKELARVGRSILFHENDRYVEAIISRSNELLDVSENDLQRLLLDVRSKLRTEGICKKNIIESFAIVREVSGRVLGMRHHHTQIRASLAILRGSIAEMATGEGKTLAATLGAATAGLAGIPVHVVTVNDYLAERDAEDMIPLYHALGLSVGIVTHEKELQERREAYACDLCYCSNKELTFDFLKDRLTLDGRERPRALQAALLGGDREWSKQLLLRGLHFAIVDEADSVFIDEARTPLIISGDEKFGAREEQLLRTAMGIAYQYSKGIHFRQDETGTIHITSKGKQLLLDLTEPLDGLWKSSFYREPLIQQALTALHVYHLDNDYIIDEEGVIQIVDPYTGRIMPGRSWGQGLQQMIEMKEGCEITKPRETNAEISYQNFFRKYHHLCGMTGTGKEVASELFTVYRLRSENIPQLKDNQRQSCYQEVYKTETEKWLRVAEVVRQLINEGQAVLIGTNAVAASEAASKVLDEQGISHKVLNARQDKEEAETVADAGQAGAVMVSTSMAGRGTDIKLSDKARNAGGLHVIITELQDSKRIDRQLAGRSARQGDPGSVSVILSLEDPLVIKKAKPWLKQVIKTIEQQNIALPHKLGYLIQMNCQKSLEKAHYRQRMQMIKLDSQRQKTLAFAGGNK